MTRTMTTTKFAHHPENVPEELVPGDVWVTCDEFKVPLIPIESGAIFAASSTNPDTWRPYEVALKTWQENDHVAGIGRVIGADEDLVGVDLDDSVDPETGEILPWASRIVERLDSYAEISPSLTGIKIWVKAPEITISYKKPGLEIYAKSRYFTITGIRIAGSASVITDAGDELARIIEEEFPKIEREASRYDGPTRVLNLEDLLERASVEIFQVALDGLAERKYKIRCPWYEEHTDADVSGTYTGQYENGALFFACWHSHCTDRRWREFRHRLEELILGRPRSRRGRLR